MLGGKDISPQCRKPEIVADAAYAMLSKDSKSYTGQFAIDDDVLRAEGITDFDPYAFDPKGVLMPDFFLDALDEAIVGKVLQNDSKSAEQMATESASGEAKKIEQVFDSLKTFITTETIGKAKSLYVFNITIPGAEQEQWYLDLKSESGGTGKGLPSTDPDVTFTLSVDNFRESMINISMRLT